MIFLIILFTISNLNIKFYKDKNITGLKLIEEKLNSSDFCSCRLLDTERYTDICWLNDWEGNARGVDHIVGHSIIFDRDMTQVCDYLYSSFGVPEDVNLFQEARQECNPIWIENESNMIADTTSATISFDGKYIIPYCYGMENLYIYKIKALDGEYGGEFILKNVLNFPDKVEAARFFKDYLIVLDSKKITAYSMKKGKEFEKIGHFELPHTLYTPFKGMPWVQMPTFMRNMEMDGNFLYLLNPPGNNYGPLLTFKIEKNKIKLLNDGSTFKASFHEFPYVWRRDLMLNEAHNKKYLIFEEIACGNKYKYRQPMLRLEDGIPNPIEKYLQEEDFNEICDVIYGAFAIFKNEYYYIYVMVDGPPCPTHIDYFTEDEKFIEPSIPEQVYSRYLLFIPMYQGSDTELWYPAGRYVSCSTDDLPTMEYLILPEEASQNFLVMGRTYDSEGIRRVFAGFPIEPAYFRANIFEQKDGSVLFMAVIPERDFYWYECSKEKPFAFMAIAEDIDGDTNDSPDVPYERDWRCIKFKEEKDPLPFGYLDLKPEENDRVLKFSGWALDNSGIKQGWLFSEDANVLVPIVYGIERPDVKEKYPEYPDSLNSGFSVEYDTKNLEDGVYEFTLRLMAKDFQVLDFGPFKIKIEEKHKRPF